MSEYNSESAGAPFHSLDAQPLQQEPIPWHPEKLADETDFYAYYTQAAEEQASYARKCLSVTVHSSLYTIALASFAGLVRVSAEAATFKDPLLDKTFDTILDEMQAFGMTTATIAGTLAVGAWFLARRKIAEARQVARQALDDELRTIPPST